MTTHIREDRAPSEPGAPVPRHSMREERPEITGNNGNETVPPGEISVAMRTIERICRHWRRLGREVVVLQAMCHRFAENPGLLKPSLMGSQRWGIDLMDLASALVAYGVSDWHPKSWQDDPDDARSIMRRIWKKLVGISRSQSEVISEALAKEGLPFTVQIHQTTGGGRANRNRYGFTFEPRSPGLARREVDLAAVPQVDYQRVSVVTTGLAGWLARSEYALQGRSKAALIVLGVLVTYALAALLLLLAKAVLHASSSEEAFAAALLIVFLVGLPLATLWRLLVLGRYRIGVAPAFFQRWSPGGDRIIEIRREHSESGGTQAFMVHYVADCPICGESGKESVRASSGGIEFFGRIVGRCTNAPREHVFSFDHVSRRGRFLR